MSDLNEDPPVLHVGVTATRLGLSDHQREWITRELDRWHESGQEVVLHHGDCIGGDAELHALFSERGHEVILHPPVDPSQRAFCPGAVHVNEPKPFRTRNMDIVRAADHVYGFVPGTERSFPRSGTWMTVRIAKRLLVPLTVVGR